MLNFFISSSEASSTKLVSPWKYFHNIIPNVIKHPINHVIIQANMPLRIEPVFTPMKTHSPIQRTVSKRFANLISWSLIFISFSPFIWRLL